MSGASVDIQFLRECFILDRGTGVLTWRKRPAHHFETRRAHSLSVSGFAGKVAGRVGNHGYVAVTISGRTYLAHRVVFALIHGRWPVDQIDHINGIRTDNRPRNLREVSNAENARNGRRRSRNTSGHVGVSWDAVNSKWKAEICRDGKRIALGRFKLLSLAVGARKAAEREYGFHPNHGRHA